MSKILSVSIFASSLFFGEFAYSNDLNPSEIKGKQRIAVIQSLLTKCGFKPGPVDGLSGENTISALKGFRKIEGYEGDASISNKDLRNANKKCGPISLKVIERDLEGSGEPVFSAKKVARDIRHSGIQFRLLGAGLSWRVRRITFTPAGVFKRFRVTNVEKLGNQKYKVEANICAIFNNENLTQNFEVTLFYKGSKLTSGNGGKNYEQRGKDSCVESRYR